MKQRIELDQMPPHNSMQPRQLVFVITQHVLLGWIGGCFIPSVCFGLEIRYYYLFKSRYLIFEGDGSTIKHKQTRKNRERMRSNSDIECSPRAAASRCELTTAAASLGLAGRATELEDVVLDAVAAGAARLDASLVTTVGAAL
jgi:hypothetical protein